MMDLEEFVEMYTIKLMTILFIPNLSEVLVLLISTSIISSNKECTQLE